MKADHDQGARAFVYALAAITINLTHSIRTPSAGELTQISHGAYKAIETLPPVTSAENISVWRVATSQFIHVSLMGLEQVDLAFYYLRHSIAMVQIIRVDDERGMAALEAVERSRWQRLYWLVFIHERQSAGGALVALSGMTTVQQADLVITKQWMRMLVWQIAMSKCLLSSAAHEEPTSLLFPVGISTQLRAIIGSFSKHEVEVHGTGIQQKLFELTDTIASVVLTVPAASDDEAARRIDDFGFLFDFWRSLPRPNARQLDILETKAKEIEGIRRKT